MFISCSYINVSCWWEHKVEFIDSLACDGVHLTTVQTFLSNFCVTIELLQMLTLNKSQLQLVSCGFSFMCYATSIISYMCFKLLIVIYGDALQFAYGCYQGCGVGGKMSDSES